MDNSAIKDRNFLLLPPKEPDRIQVFTDEYVRFVNSGQLTNEEIAEQLWKTLCWQELVSWEVWKIIGKKFKIMCKGL